MNDDGAIKVRVRNHKGGALYVPAHVLHVERIQKDEHGQPVPALRNGRPILVVDDAGEPVPLRNEQGKPIPGKFEKVSEIVIEAEARPALNFEIGDTIIDLDDLNRLPETLQNEVAGWAQNGWIEMLPADAPELVAPVEEPAPDMSHVTALIPTDDAAAIELVNATSDAATLDAMFAAVGDRTAVSDAIMHRLQSLETK